MPDRNDRDPKARARAGIAAFYASQGVLVHHPDHFVAVVERVPQILDQLGLGRGSRRAALLAIGRWSLAFNLIEERELSASDVLDLLAEAARIVELAGGRNEGIFRIRHGFGDRKELSFRKAERTGYAVGDGFRNRGILGENPTGEKRQDEERAHAYRISFSGWLLGLQQFELETMVHDVGDATTIV